MLDLLIANGMIVDGTGNPGFYGAVAVEGETIRILRGDVSHVQAARTIDATGHVVSPGFIDMHAHTGLVILAEPHHEPKIRQGITTELVGIDGNSYAPFHSQDDFDKFYQLNSGLDGAPTLPGRWSTVAEYLAMFDNKVAVNICYIVGNSPLRINTVGWQNQPATDRDLANMKSLLREAMEEGAYGMSTGLDYPPGSYATTEELIELSKEAAKLGGIYHTHCRHRLGDASLDPFKEAIEIGRRSGIASHITHFYQRVGSKHGAERAAGPGGGRPREGRPGRHLRQLPVRLQRHAPADPLPGVVPGGRPGEDHRGLPGSGRARSPARGGPATGGRLAGHVDHLLQEAAQPHLRGQVAGRAGDHDRQARRGRDDGPAAGRGLADLVHLARRQREHPAEVRQPPVLDGRL